MKNTWVLSIKTSLPKVCESAGELKTHVFTFESFEDARAALRKALKKYAFSKNSMFDGKGNIIYFKKEVDDFVEWEQTYDNEEFDDTGELDDDEISNDVNDEDSEDCDYEDEYYDDELTAEKLVSINENLISIFKGEDVIPEILPKGENLMFGYIYEDGVLSTYSGYDGPINGCFPIIKTNMFSMEVPQHYYMYIDDAFGQDSASSELYIDLIRAREFDENSLFADMTEESANEAFAADMKDMFQDLIDMGDAKGCSIEDKIRSAISGEYGTRELPDVGTRVDDIYTVIRCPVCYNKTLDSYDICCHCGWEYDDFPPDHYSAANGSTLLEYREAYNKIAKEMANSLLQKMYFITCFSNFESDYEKNYRTFGYFSDIDTCREALHENACDMCEARYYTLALIEEISEGVYPHAKKLAWFRWDEERKGFYETEEPEWADGWYGFALG